MKREFAYILFIISISLNSVFAQSDFREGYIINLENDTLRGQVDYRTNSKNYKSCIFKRGESSTEYYPNQIIGFGYVNDKFFSSRIIDNEFVEVLVYGNMDLYKSEELYLLKKTNAIYELKLNRIKVEKDGKIGYIEDTKWKGVVSFLINDCQSGMKNIINKLKFTERALVNLTVKYNKCTSDKFTVFKTSKPWTKIDFGVSVGLAKSDIKISDEFGLFSFLDESYSSFDPTVGVLVAFSSPRLSERIAFQAELSYLQSSYSSLVQIESLRTEFHDTFIDLTTLSIPVSFKYSFPEKKFSTYFQGGINYDYHIDSEAKLLTESVVRNVVSTFDEVEAFEINTNQVGIWGGLGLLKSFANFRMSTSIRYFQISNLNKTGGFTANNSRISFNVILLNK